MKKSKIFRYVLLVLCLFSLLVGCTRTVYVPLPPNTTGEEDKGFKYYESECVKQSYVPYYLLGIASDKHEQDEDEVALDCYYWADDGLQKDGDRYTYSPRGILYTPKNVFAMDYISRPQEESNDTNLYANVYYYVADKDFYENELEGMKLSKIKQYPQETSPYFLIDTIDAYDLMEGKGYFPYNFAGRTSFAKKASVILPKRLFTQEKGELIFYANPLSDEDTKRDRAAIMTVAYECKDGKVTLLPEVLKEAKINYQAIQFAPENYRYLKTDIKEMPTQPTETQSKFVFSYQKEFILYYNNRIYDQLIASKQNATSKNLIKQVRCVAVLSTKECYENTLQKQKTRSWYHTGEEFTNRGFDVSVLDNADETSPFVIVGEIPMRDFVEGNEIYVKEVTVPSHLLAQSEGELVFSCEFYFDVDEFFSGYYLPRWYNVQEVEYAGNRFSPMRNVYCEIAYQKQADGTIVFTCRQTI